MLKLAVKSGMPLVAATTRDVLNLPDVLMEVTGRKPVRFDPAAGLKPSPSIFYVLVAPPKEVKYEKLYAQMTEAGSTLLVVNPPKIEDAMFFAGEVPVPRSLLLSFLMEVAESKAHAEALLGALGGCTIKEAAEYARLTMARDASLTAKGLTLTRKQFFHGGSGLTQVDTAQAYYAPPAPLWGLIKRERAFFLSSTDPRLTPRGILMDGPPGTGKTAASKFIAEQWGVPLYRVDIGGTKNKYLGNSEANMLANLTRLDQEAPCVVLFDEMEKVFGGGEHDHGTTTTMLSQLLWWLAEHTSRVFTVMTTNAKHKLPPELYREGRIDEVLYFDGLPDSDAPAFVASVLKTFGVTNPAMVAQIVEDAYDSGVAKVSQAALTKACITAVKSAK